MGLTPSPSQILFVYATSGGALYHLGASYIQAHLKRHSIDSRQFIQPADINLKEWVQQVLAVGSRIIGFTCYDDNYYISKLLAQQLKHLHPELIIIFGGPTASFLDRLIMRDSPAIDICVRGEGEHTVLELLKQLPNQNKLENIPGITFRRGDRLIRTPLAVPDSGSNPAAALDIFPSPFLEGIIPPQFITSVGLSASRGCPYNCIYCNFSSISGKSIRYHSAARIMAELKHIETVLKNRLAEGQKARLAINDDIFTLDIERAKHICRLIIEQRFEHLELFAETRADKVDEELLQLLYAAGVREINFGLESAVPRVLHAVKKVSRGALHEHDFELEKKFIAQLKQRVQQAQQIGLNPTVSIISGLPTETLADAEYTIQWVKKLNVCNYFHNTLSIYAGTELFRTHPRYGLRLSKSATTLPFYHQMAYDLNRVPVIDERHTCFKYGMLTEESRTRHVLRLWGVESDHASLLTDILITGYSALEDELIDWLTRNTHLSTQVCVLRKPDESFAYHRSINQMVARQALIPQMNHLAYLPTPQSTDIKRYVWASGLSPDGFYPPHMHDFYLTPLRDFERLQDVLPKLVSAKSICLFSLENVQDISVFEQLIENLQAGLSGIPPLFVDYRCGIMDECRWSANACPAAGLSRLNLNERGISPCINGRVMGQLADEPALINDRLRALKKKTEQERGCQHCAVQAECSRCLFPYPLADTDYCHFRRKHPRLGEVMSLVSYLRKIFLYRQLSPGVFADLFPQLKVQHISEIERFISAYNLYRQAKQVNL